MEQSIWFQSYPETIPHTITIENKTMVDAFYEAVRDKPEHLALVQDEEQLTYAELCAQVHKFANALTKERISKRRSGCNYARKWH